MDKDLSLKDLCQYFGTQAYHKEWMNTTVTDGIKYIMNNGYSWFVTDAISVFKTKANLLGQEFLSIKLKLLDGNKAKMVITDGNEKILYEQKYEYTDAQKEFTLYYMNEVLLYSGEY